jgi:cytochrome P450
MASENPNPQTLEVNLFDPQVSACPQPVYRRMLEGCPVARASIGGGAVISRYEDVTWALRHPEIFSSAMDLQIALGTERPMIPQQIDPPEQTKYRKLLDPRFSRKRMLELAPAVRADANRLIDGFIEKGECEFDRDFAIPLPCNAFLHLMGLPPEELDTFLRLKDGIIRPHMLTEDMAEVQAIRIRTGREIYAYFEDLIAVRRRQPLDDLMTYLVTAELKGEKLTDHEILDICFLLLLAGLDTVTATLGCNIAYLGANPEQRRRLVSQPELVDDAVEELLRWETPVTGVPRLLKQDVTLHGVDMKEGELVTLLLGASNTDDEEFGNAADVDLARERNRHLAFGGGTHRCLGSHLARMELRVALEEWHKRIPDYEIKPGETPTYSAGIREVQYLPIVWPASS